MLSQSFLPASPGLNANPPTNPQASPNPDAGFIELIRRVRDGDGKAATEFVQRYEPVIRCAARVRLFDSRFRSVFDSMDICQSVLASFFVRAAQGQYELEEPQNLLKLLVSMARHKVADQVRREQAGRRDARRLVRTDGLAVQLRAPGAPPDELVSADELLRKFQERLTAEEKELAAQRAAGREWNEIAAERGATPEALRKQLSRAIDRIATELQLDGFAQN